MYHNNLDNKRVEREAIAGSPMQIMDIEELVKFGEQHETCPYYMSKENQDRAEIVFLPYNYLIDPAVPS